MNTAPSNWESNVLPGAAQFKLLKLSKRVLNVNITSLELERAQIGSRCILCAPYISDKARIDKGITQKTSAKLDMKDVMEWNSVCIIIPKLLGANFTSSLIQTFFLSKHLQFVSFIQMKGGDV
jgi:hypothetical protein